MNSNFAATIGNFDGVHLGHQELIGKIKQAAKKNNLKTKVITFNPYPFEFFQWKKKRIMSEFDKNKFLNNINVFFEDTNNFFKKILKKVDEQKNSYKEHEYFLQTHQKKTICVSLTVTALIDSILKSSVL